MMYTQHHDTIQTEYFYCPKNSLCSINTSSPPNPWKSLIFLLYPWLLFPECHIFELIQYLASSDWFISFSHMHLLFPMSLHGLITHFILALNVIPLYKCTSLCIHSPTEGYLNCFQVWTIMDKVVLNVYVQVFVWTSAFISFG